jgi:4-hydroxybutyrate CoA-transferase
MTSGSTVHFGPYLAPSRGPRGGLRAEPAAAFARIPDGARVLVTSACGTPLQLLEELDAARDRWTDLTLVAGQLLGPIAPAAHAGQPFRFLSIQPSQFLSAASDGGPAQVVPARYSDTASLFLPSGPLAVDAVLVQVSAEGPGGRFSLGVSVGAVIDAVRSAPLVIAQVNRQMPYTFGAGELRRDEIDVLVEIDGPLLEVRRPVVTAEIETIARNVLTQVPDEATLQFGVGSIPEATMALLGQRRDLGIHSGMISDGIVDLVESGAVTNRRKAFDQGLTVAGEVMGTRRLFDWVHLNPLLQMAPSRYTHGVPVVAGCHRFVSIQSALEVALDGSINAESIGDRQVGGPGGQPDFVEAAAAAVDGIAIHALQSTAAGGTVSRIVPQLDAGTIVTTPRYLADRVVTEYGVAQLRGQPLPRRAAALAAIAHPHFRPGLQDAPAIR